MLVKFEQKRMLQTSQDFEVFVKNKTKQKWLTIFDKAFNAILEDVSVTETIDWC